ncbi:MAG: SUKH-4 family immunity protein [Pirellulales bacterium]
MITPKEFRAIFAKRGLVQFSATAVRRLSLAAADANWLTEIGLPRSAAPYIDFGGKHVIEIPTAADMWRIPNASQYYVIGSNGSGDPVAIDTASQGQVVYLNHDDNFCRVFINSSVLQLAESLVAYVQLIRETQAVNGPDAFLDGNVPPTTQTKFAAAMSNIDSAAIHEGLWMDELAQFKKKQAGT